MYFRAPRSKLAVLTSALEGILFRLAALQQAGFYKHVRWPLHVSSANGMSKVRLAGDHFPLSRKGNNPRTEKSKETQQVWTVDDVCKRYFCLMVEL